MIKTSKRFFISPRRAVSINNSIFARQYKSSMKPFVYIAIWVFLLIGIPACQRHTDYPPAMQQAEKLMDTRPDSALHQLQGMADTLAMLSDEAQMYYHLLTIQAKDKQYITHTDDSLINSIVSFYEDSGDKDRLMLAYFYQGSTYRDMNDAPRALKAFQQAVDLKVPNLDLLAKTYNQMGTLFMYQGLHDEVIRANRKAIELYLLQGKRNKISYFLRDIARMYSAKEMADSALYYYKEACQTALADGDSNRYYGIFGELGGYHYKKGRTDEAKRILLKAEKESNQTNKSHIYINLGNIYEENQQWDSAYHYYEKVLVNGNIHKKCYTYYNLGWMESRKGNHLKAMEHMKQYVLLKDSIDSIKETETIAKINALYNYQHTEEENNKLILSIERGKNKNLFLLLILSIFTIGVLIVFYHIKKKVQETLRVERVLKQIEEDKHNNSLAIIKENEQKIFQLSTAAQQCDHLQRELNLLQKEMLELRNREIVETNNNEELRIATFQQSSLYILLQDASNGKATVKDEDWERIQSMMDYVYPHFRKRLYDIYSQLSTMEERICILLKFSFSPTGIARIVNRTGAAVANARKRLHKKIHKTDENSEKFDEFIRSL